MRCSSSKEIHFQSSGMKLMGDQSNQKCWITQMITQGTMILVLSLSIKELG